MESWFMDIDVKALQSYNNLFGHSVPALRLLVSNIIYSSLTLAAHQIMIKDQFQPVATGLYVVHNYLKNYTTGNWTGPQPLLQNL
jgi:hypothetical protein